MKRAFILLITFCTFACKQNTKTNQSQNSADLSQTELNVDFDWLKGNWRRTNDKDGKQTFENWRKVSPNRYHGFGFTIHKTDTLNQEEMQLIRSNGKWQLLVKSPDEKEFITFKIKEQVDKKLVFVNDSIEFPKKIQYTLENEKLKALISNEEIKIAFDFERVKKFTE